eukprot:728365-Amorphochlora_amoeboformis.AAC.1
MPFELTIVNGEAPVRLETHFHKGCHAPWSRNIFTLNLQVSVRHKGVTKGSVCMDMRVVMLGYC